MGTSAWQSVSGVVLLFAALVCPTVAHADLVAPPGAPVPTPDEVSAILVQLTDPNIADEDKAQLVDGGLSPDQLTQNDEGLATLVRHSALPFTFTVTDIQPAINNLVGVTVAMAGPKNSAPVVAPLVLVNHDGTWQLTHDSYDPTLVTMARRVIKHVTRHPSENIGARVAIFGW